MTELPRRPTVIWVAQIVLLLFGIPLSLAAMFAILRDLSYVTEAGLTIQILLALLVSIAFRAGIILVFFFAFWGLVKRRSYGRWLTVGVIGLFAVASILGQLFRPSGSTEYWEYENDTQRMGGIFANIIIFGLTAFFLYRLSFGESVYDFFHPETEVAESSPPPPDTYSL